MDCSICFCTLQTEGCDNKKLCCGHEYHTACINTWLEKSRTCPLCRCDVTELGASSAEGFDVPVPMSVILARFRRLLREYANADDIDEKNFKKHRLYDMIRRYHLSYDDRVCIALSEHNLPVIYS